jgi:branched-chain amino acid transport system permease protein
MDFFAQQTVNGLVMGSAYALYAVGFGLVMANLKIFFVTHAAIFTWGAIFAWELTTRLHLPLMLALPIAAVLAGAANVVAYVVLVRRLLQRNNSELVIFIASLGGLIVLTELAHHFLGGTVVRIPQESFAVTPWNLGPIQISNLHVLMLVVTVILIGLTAWLVSKTEFGREVRAVAFDRETAALLGVNVDAVSAGVFFLSGALAGVAATFIATAFNVVSAEMGSAYLVLALAAMVVGGFGSVGGILLGGLLIGLASTYATAFIGSAYRDLAVFALLLAFLVIRPSGIVRTPNDLQRA